MDNVTVTDQQRILDEFNHFFSKVGENLASEFSTNDEAAFELFLQNRVSPSIFMEPPRVNEVINIINSLNLNKSVGHDNISPYFLRVASDTLAPALCFIIDNAFRLGIFPTSCKIARIVPLHKSGKTDNITNYRPISILTCFSKIIEKLIHKRMSNFFQKHSVLVTSQYGFQNNMSTSHAIVDVLTSTYDHIDNNMYTGLILLDFKKAFDTVCHTTLLKKLEHYGNRGAAHKLLHSYLSDRHQYITSYDICSEKVLNRFGVPQGSNLGPSLFLIYINDIPNALTSPPRLFADDTCLVIHAANPRTLQEKINIELLNVHKWTKANKITLNPKKSSALIVPPKTTLPVPAIDLIFDNNVITISDSAKYLGITIDARLNFDEQINSISNKIARSVGVLSKLKHVLPFTALRNLYYSMIHPHLLYGISIWGNTSDRSLQQLITLQNKAVKIISGGQWRDHVTPYYEQSKILKLKDLYTYEVAKMMHKHSRKQLPSSFNSYFATVNAKHTRTTRLASSDFNLFLPRYRTKKLQRNFKYQGVKIWNSLSEELKILSFNQFKIKYKQKLLSKYK